VNRRLIGTLVGLVILLGGVAFFLVKQQTDKAQETKRAALVKVRQEKPPVFIDLTPRQAGQSALDNLTISKTSQPPLKSVDYSALAVQVSNGINIGKLFRQFYDQPISLIIVTAQNVAAQNTMPAAPILILKSTDPKSSTFNQLYGANGRILPHLKTTSGGASDVALDIHYLDQKISEQDVQFILNTAKSWSNIAALWSSELAAKMADDSNKMAALLKNHRAKFYDNLMQLHIGPERDLLFGRNLALKHDPTANIELMPALQSARFANQTSDKSITVKTGEIDQFLQLLGAKSEQLQVNFWLNEGEGFIDTCRDLSSALADDTGLSVTDTALLMWALIHRHAWFAKDIDYQTDCLNEAQSAALNRLGLNLPTKANTRQSTPKNAAMNRTVARLVNMLRRGETETAKVKLNSLLADKLSLLDRAGFWLFGDSVKQNESGRILESTDPATATEQLLTLPVSHFGCFSRGDGLKGRHRATLAQLDSSTELRQLEFAFNTNGKIAGVTLNEADNETICRAIDGRRSGQNTCYFTRRAKQFPMVARAKCGG